MDKDYEITNVQKRDDWTGTHGTFASYALQLKGVDGWVELSQKPETKAPAVGTNIFGKIESHTKGDKTYYKFKKSYGDKPFNNGSSINQKDIDYIIQMLEELTLRRDSPEIPSPRDDTVLTAEEYDKIKDAEKAGFDLSEIPF